MANINIKTNFVDGEKLFAQQLNNNFRTIQEGMNADNKIIWQDGEEVLFKRYITNDIENLPIVNGSIIYDVEKGRHYIDYNGERIQVGSAGKEVLVQDIQPIEEDNKIWIESDFVNTMGTEVVDSLDGDETNMSPSVRAVKEDLLDVYSKEEVKTDKVWIDGKPIYRKVYYYETITFTKGAHVLDIDLPNLDCVTDFKYSMFYPILSKWYVNWDTIDAHNIMITSKSCEIGSGDGNSVFTRASFVFEYTKTTDSEVISNEV